MKGVILKDRELTAEFTSEPRIYGNANISEEEIKILKLPPEYGLYKKIDVQSMTIETERALNKLRWKKIIGENESAEKEESTLVNVSDDGKKKVNINNLKCTELPFNPNVAMPHSVSFSEEVKYHQFKEDVKTISEKYKKKTQDMSNLTAEERTGLKALKKN